MKSKKALYTLFGLMLPLSMVLCGFQVKKVDTVIVSGVVDKVDKGTKFIVVNEVKVSLSPDTLIVDEQGNILKPDSLKQKAHLLTEVVCKPDGYWARKITVQTTKKGR